MAYDRPSVIARVVEGLAKGIPLTVLCAYEDMPTPATIRLWRDEDETFAIAYARAREDGFDAIAEECLAIADNTTHDTRLTGKDEGEREVANTEWITRSRLRVETRLKLLAKWDPKRYGDRTLVGSDPDNPLPAGVNVSFKN